MPEQDGTLTAEPVATPTPADQPGEPVTPTEGADPNAPDDKQTTDAKPSRANERIRQLVEENRDRQAEIDRLNTELEARQPAPRKPAPTGDSHPKAGHPALMGQAPDDDGDVYLGGMWQKAEDVIERYDRDERLAKLEGKLDNFEKSRQQADKEAADAQHRQNMAEAVLARISEIREDKYAHFEGQDAEELEGDVLLHAERALNEAFEKGKFTPELAEKVIQAAYETVMGRTSRRIALQLNSNKEHGTKYKGTKPGQVGDKPPIPPEKMTQQQRRDWAIQKAANVERRLRGE